MNKHGLSQAQNLREVLQRSRTMLWIKVRSFPCVAGLAIVQVAICVNIVSRLQSAVITVQSSPVTAGNQWIVKQRQIYTGARLNFTETKDDRNCLKNFLDDYSKYCRTSIVPSEETERRNHKRLLQEGSDKVVCPCLPENLHGRIDLNVTIGESAKSDGVVETVPAGVVDGRWSPSWCRARQRVAVIVPFRNRHSHLEIFIRVMHPFLQRQLLQYTIFVVEQVKPSVFNKASLMNAGFNVTASRNPDFDCFIFHDVDILPEDDRNFYGCYGVPRHLAAFVDKYKYRMKYGKMFGGATAFTRKQFELCNGFSNEYYGWGGEDDDMWNRVKAANMTILRFPDCVSKYTMLRHGPDELNPRNSRAAIGWKYRPDVYRRNGLNSLSYNLIRYEERQLYTWIAVALPQPPTPPKTWPLHGASSKPR